MEDYLEDSCLIIKYLVAEPHSESICLFIADILLTFDLHNAGISQTNTRVKWKDLLLGFRFISNP